MGLNKPKMRACWADFRMTRYQQIEKWWELVMSSFLMVSLFADQFNNSCPLAHQQFVHHPWWDKQSGWKNLRGQPTAHHSTTDLFQLA